MLLLVVAAACFGAAAAGVALFTRWAARAQLFDLPNARSSHRVPIPRGAGVVVVAVVAAACAWGAPADPLTASPVALVALLVAIVGGIDDVRPLPSGLRLLVHLLCATVAVDVLAASGFPRWPPALVLAAILWVAGLTNAYNFMDGIDGISGAQAIVAGMAVTFAAVSVGLGEVAVAGVAIAGASAGFLLHNWTPARVFIGDVGATFLGFAFALIALRVASASAAAASVIVLSLWPYVFDTTLTFLRRLSRRENVFASHRSHLYQRLVIAGWSHPRVALLYVAMGSLAAVSGSIWSSGAAHWMVPFAVAAGLAVGLCWLVLRVEAAGRARRRGWAAG